MALEKIPNAWLAVKVHIQSTKILLLPSKCEKKIGYPIKMVIANHLVIALPTLR